MPTADTDQGGDYVQWMRVWRGPSLGWSMVQIKPPQSITAAGTTTLTAGSSIVLVNVAGLVTVNLPDVSKWLQESANQPSNAFEGAIWIKDFGGNAAAFNITVHPFTAQKIDNLAQDFVIVQNRQLLRLYPLNDLTGWYSG